MSVEKRDPAVHDIPNKNYVSDLNHAIYYTRWFLTLLGIWPYVITKPTRLEKLVSILMLPLCSISMLMLVVPIVSHVTLRDIDRSETLVLLGPIIFQTFNIIKHFVLVFRSDSIKLCVQHMETDWRRLENQNDRDIMMQNLRVGHSLTVICTICMYSGCLFYQVLMPLCSSGVINELNETVRPLACPGTDIYVDSQASGTYEIVFFGMCISGFFHFTLVIGIFNLASILVTHACGQIQILMSRLSGLVHPREENNDVYSIGIRLSFIIRWHVRVLKFSSRIDQVLREICLMEVFTSTAIICLVEYYCMTEWSNGNGVAMMTYVLLLLSMVFNIFIYCHVGELLKDQCFQVGKAAYMIEWYRLPGKTGLALVLIIAMANCPRKLTAGRILELSIITFGTIIRTTLAYLNMLRSMA